MVAYVVVNGEPFLLRMGARRSNRERGCPLHPVSTTWADAVLIQDVISEKLRNLIHYMATFIFGFIVGFTIAWQLALVTLTVVSLVMLIGDIHAMMLAKLLSNYLTICNLIIPQPSSAQNSGSSSNHPA